MKSFETKNTVSFYFSKKETMQSNIRLTTAGGIYPGYVIDEIVKPMSKTIAAPNTKVLSLIGIRLDFDQFSCQFFDKDGAIIVDEEYAIELAKELEENEGKMNLLDEDYSFVTLFFCKQGQCDKYTHPLQKEETEDAAPVIQVNASEDAQTENNVSENASGEMGEPAAQSQKTKESSVNEHAQNMEFQVRAEQQTVAPEEVNKVASRTTIDVQDIMNQITEFAKVNLSPENSSIEMQLNPENLGKVYLHIAATKEGNITAELAVSSETVKTALEAQIADLRTSLNQQGIKVDAVEVAIASHEFERNLEQNASGEEQQGSQREESGRTAGRRLFRGELDELSGLMNEEEALAAQIMKDHGNTMDVTA